MPDLKPRPLGTSRADAPVNWVIHKMGSALVGEFFTSGYYRDCLTMAERMAPRHRPALKAIHESKPESTLDVEGLIANLEDVSRWARDERLDGYHTVNTHVFITLWAAQEAGMENVAAEIVRTNRDAASTASAKFAPGRFSMADWPWQESTCIEIAQRLDGKAKDATANGGIDLAARLKTLFSWFGLGLEVPEAEARTYNEASMVRNVILHRYGALGQKDVESFPALLEWRDKVLPMNTERLRAYHAAVVAVYMSLARAVWASSYK